MITGFADINGTAARFFEGTSFFGTKLGTRAGSRPTVVRDDNGSNKVEAGQDSGEMPMALRQWY